MENADTTFNKAVATGAKPTMPIMDMFWGDRFGQFQDPLGHIWGIATHKKDMSPEEINKAGQEFFKNCQQNNKTLF